MGYDTTFDGSLQFTSELNAKAIARLNLILNEDARKHPEWNAGELTWIDFELTPDFDGIQWNGSEKTYDAPEKINLIIRLMQEEFPEFGLEGKLEAFGQERDDLWILKVVDNVASRTDRQPVYFDGEPVQAKELTTITHEGTEVTLYQDPQSGAIFGIDSSYIVQCFEDDETIVIPSPYNLGTEIKLP